MPENCVYMDNHSTTRVDPRVVDAMAPFLTEMYGNPGSTSHPFGWEAKEAIDTARKSIATSIGAKPREIVFTSGATESNNLAIRGLAERHANRGKHLISVKTEHRAVLDPLDRLSRRDFEITLLDVHLFDSPDVGLVDLDQLEATIREDTILVSIMLANNEIGLLQPIKQVAEICRKKNTFLHVDATQAVGKIPVDVVDLDVDLMSFSSHKIYGPRGVGALFVRRRSPQVRLVPLMDGGGQEGGMRSGTLNTPGIVGLAKALQLCDEELSAETARLATLRNNLFRGLQNSLSDIHLNGPALDPVNDEQPMRLAGNLNVAFDFVDGEALMMSMGNLAVSSDSACTSANPEPSHVLRAIGRTDDQTRSSLRFGLGRFNTSDDVEFAIQNVSEAVTRLRNLSSMH